MILIINIFISGCTKQPEVKKPSCIIHPTSKDGNITVVQESFELSQEESELKVVDDSNESDEVVGEYCIVDVFTDSIFLDGDRLKLIKNLDALPWEKKVLLKAYKKDSKFWNKQQKKEFDKILEEDKYLSLCGDQRYYDNLLFTSEEPQLDILHSILLLRYAKNLSNGCLEWVSSDIKNENDKKRVPAKSLLKMVKQGAIVERLFVPFVPKTKAFDEALKAYHKAISRGENPKSLTSERMFIEEQKSTDIYPDYN